MGYTIKTISPFTLISFVLSLKFAWLRKNVFWWWSRAFYGQFILPLVCGIIFSLLLQLFFKRSLRKKRERNVSLASNSWVSTQFKLWILEILSVDICWMFGDFLMASGTSQSEYFFLVAISGLLQPWSHGLGDVILFAFCSTLPLCNVDKKVLSNTGSHVTIFFCNTESGLSGGADIYSVDFMFIWHIFPKKKKKRHSCGKVKRR